ncbi:MAG: type II toxin-antitoxin system Phd/YefM family antitoxin [Clostridia bacterium]|nr:type II toxin-antitoxin system Phd/YefM family antitoxin [Clostridia bacterium]
MNSASSNIISISEASKNFAAAASIADKNGQAVITEDDKPKYILYDIDSSPIIDMTDDEKIDFVAARILKKYKPAFLELAK